MKSCFLYYLMISRFAYSIGKMPPRTSFVLKKDKMRDWERKDSISWSLWRSYIFISPQIRSSFLCHWSLVPHLDPIYGPLSHSLRMTITSKHMQDCEVVLRNALLWRLTSGFSSSWRLFLIAGSRRVFLALWGGLLSSSLRCHLYSLRP